MTPISFTGFGALVIVIEQLLKLFGFEFPEGSAAAALNGLITFGGFVFLIWGQLRRKDLRFGLVRK